jgi:hypothetical protein
MMGRLNHDQGRLIYSLCLDGRCRTITSSARLLAFSTCPGFHSELASYYPQIGRPSIDPELMIRMLIIDYVFAIRSERALCRDVQVNLAFRWFCGLSIEDKVPDHSAPPRARNERSCPPFRLPHQGRAEWNNGSHPVNSPATKTNYDLDQSIAISAAHKSSMWRPVSTAPFDRDLELAVIDKVSMPLGG